MSSLAQNASQAASVALADPQPPASNFGLLARILLGTVKVIPGLLYWIITFTTITLPTWIFTLASMSLTVTMNATTLLLLFLAFGSTVSWFVRYRFLNMYTRLPPEPQREEPHVEVFPDTQEGDSKRGLSNYLDEFLSAIKVFGYLERPVFHELTRTMQTRKLIAGETLLLEEEKGFCLVVDGLVQIFVKSNRDESTYDSGISGTSSDDEDGDVGGHQQGYQLLTEVKNGAPMSSLFSILSLFTEDIKLRHDEDQGIDSAPPTAGGPRFQHVSKV
ncbi:putative patatin-like serine hydrolase protein [Neofusicoccum parvum UCRNP2]|uniref:Putative patatin-like serine hydrolase protein n=1 Tax=Botryosphaeria parva (strain UCR-NP2) TaxID=1287680 RepID=R1EM55_BOTPV|nr:putative patatin-like serine hydrolase protein [Neofusicoccum parvum UCRNP2]